MWPCPQKENELKDTYNADEFGWFYEYFPNKTYQLKSEKCSIGKLSKKRITGYHKHVCLSTISLLIPKLKTLGIKLFIFPPNRISQTQPMGQGVIRSMTAQYRKNIPRKIVWSLEKKKNLPKNFSATRNANVSCILESSNNENRCELFSKV